MTDKEKLKLLSVAILLEDNAHLSSSAIALKRRSDNRRKAKEIALELLGHSEEEFQEISGVNHERQIKSNRIHPRNGCN